MKPTAQLLQEGRLSQTCPCGITEAAGSHCSRCLRPMSEDDWYVAERSQAQRDALSRAQSRAGANRPSGAKESANPGLLA